LVHRVKSAVHSPNLCEEETAMNEKAVCILLVEDEASHAELVRRAFQYQGNHVNLTVAGTLEEARGCLARSTPDLMITDLLLPDGEGTELLPPREEEYLFPIVLMTGQGNEQVAVEVMKAGVVDYVIKSKDTLAEMPRIARRALSQWEDRSEHKRTQRRLRFLSSAVEQTAEGIAVSDLKGNLLFVNDAFATMHGYSPEELAGEHLSILHTPDLMPAVEAANRQIRETGDFSGEIWHLRRDGAGFPGLMRNTLLRDEEGAPIGMIGTLRDITELKRTEEELTRHRNHFEELVEERTFELEQANRRLQREISERIQAGKELRESEQRFRTLFETTPHGIVEIDTVGTILSCNRAYEGMLGYDDGTLAGTSLVDIIRPEHRAAALAEIKMSAARQPEPSLYEIQHITKDGRAIDCEVAWDYKHDPKGNVAAFVCVVTDVTKRKQAEETIRKEQRLLRQLLDLQEQERRLVAYEIHDGLAQQLAGAQMAFQTFDQLRDQDEDVARQTFDGALELLAESMTEARRLISGLRPPILDEAGIVAAIDYLVCERRQHCAMEIEFHHDLQSTQIASPLETAVFRMVQETLNNACRHSRSDKIRVNLVEQANRIRIEVRDWGIGFDPEKIEENRFGLEGIRERARLLGGQVVIETAPNRGTRVTVELPLVDTPPDETEP